MRAIPASILGLAYASTGRMGEGIRLLQDTVKVASALGAPVLTFLGEAHLLSGQVEAAHEVGTQALGVSVQRQERGWEAWARRLIAEAAASRSVPEIDAAEESYLRAAGAANELGMRPLVARCHLGLGQLYESAGRPEAARRHLEVAATVFDELGMRCWRDRRTAHR